MDCAMQTHPGSTPKEPLVPARLAALRERMRERGLQAVVVRSTDAYLNEYVPEAESTRVWLTGFTGSMGDGVVTGDRALLFVDGRYTLQAAREAPDFESRTVPLGASIEQGWLGLFEELGRQGVKRIGVETDRMPQSLYETVQRRAAELSLELVPTVPSLLEELRRERGEEPRVGGGKTWAIDPALSGRTVRERLPLAHALLDDKKLDGLLVVALDEIAWVSNLRGAHFPYQATFRATALTTRDEVLLILGDGAAAPAAESGVSFVTNGLSGALAQLQSRAAGRAVRLGFDGRGTPAHLVASLKAQGVMLVDVESPFAAARTRKTPAELEHMARAFARADQVHARVKSWLCAAVSKGGKLTEAEVCKKTEQLFKKSGAFGLSFQVLAAAGKHGSIIHYSHPDEHTPIREGELFLLDTGAFYEGGLATDLTRTFLVGAPHVKATDEQRRLFTLVLKGAIAGMRARLPVGSTGEQLDALVRQPMWQAGLDYGHGTGHGVGVNVHESPPRVTIGSRTVLEAGQVFSIEPGLYLPDFGGIRIENLCTLVEDTETPREGVPKKFLRVKPLTFSPLDKRLIERALLNADERAFLTWFHDKGRAPLPPL